MDRHRFSWENASDLCNLNTGWSGEDKKNWISNTDRSRSNPLQCEACLSQSFEAHAQLSRSKYCYCPPRSFLPSVAIYIIIACALVSCYCSQLLFHNPTVPPWLLSEPVAPSDLRFPPRSTHIIIPSILISSVRSSNSHPDLLVTQHPLFQITPVLNTGLSLSEPLQLYKGYNAI